MYIVFGASSLFFSSFITQTEALVVMSVAQALLLIINLFGIFKLRNEISFVIPKEYESYALDIEQAKTSKVISS